MSRNGFLLDKDVVIDGAENIGLNLRLAGLGNRMIAFLLDFIIQSLLFVFLLVTGYFLGWLLGADLILPAVFIFFFVILWGYFIIFELAWRGQSPGKKLLRLKVVREDGRPVGFTGSFLRNIMRIVDFLPTLYGIGIISIFVTSREKRLGDMVGGTIVVKEPRIDLPVSPVNVPSRTGLHRPDPFQLEHRLHNLSVGEVELIRDFLERRHELNLESRTRLGRELAGVLSKKFGLESPPDAEAFLDHLGSLIFQSSGGE